MKRYIILILVAVLVLNSGLIVGCKQETQPDTELEEFRNRLVEYYQNKLTQKMTQLEQVERELAELQAEIDKVEAEFEHLKKLTSEMKVVHNLTREELEAGFKIKGVANKLTQLHEQEQELLATKQSLQEDIEELEQVLRQD